MQHVISAEEAKKITRGRTPLVPVEYQEAIKALKSCQTIDEAKYWDNKADALAAWAKIYHSDEADRESRALKLYAYRRMGELAAELRPDRVFVNGKRSMGPRSVLVDNGLNLMAAKTARALARLPEKKFNELVSLPKPPGPSAVYRGFTNLEWGQIASSWCTFRGAMSRADRRSVSKSLTDKEVDSARQWILETREFLDEFEQHLPK